MTVFVCKRLHVKMLQCWAKFSNVLNALMYQDDSCQKLQICVYICQVLSIEFCGFFSPDTV